MIMDSVALVSGYTDLRQTISRGLNLIGGLRALRSPVIIKPNICTISDNTGHSVTHPFVVETLCSFLYHQDSSLSVRIVESDSQSKLANEAFIKFGYSDLASQFQAEGYDLNIINLSECPLKEVQFEGDYFSNPELPDELLKQGYIISVAQAKTHYLTSITGVLKNLFGFLPRKKKGYYHPNISEVIVDLNRLFPINLAIVDARVGVRGWNGPETVELGKFIFGHKPVPVDATLAQLMGVDPETIQHLIQCHKYGLGTLSPAILNDTGCV